MLKHHATSGTRTGDYQHDRLRYLCGPLFQYLHQNITSHDLVDTYKFGGHNWRFIQISDILWYSKSILSFSNLKSHNIFNVFKPCEIINYIIIIIILIVLISMILIYHTGCRRSHNTLIFFFFFFRMILQNAFISDTYLLKFPPSFWN